jgi:uncharacterized protein YjiS (DUF1127 family)
MSYLRSYPSDFDNVFQLPRSSVLVVVLSRAARTFRSWGQAIEARRVQRSLLELDDHIFRDVGLTRDNVRFGDIATVASPS